MATRIIISDQDLTGHPVGVRNGIIAGYGSDISSQVEIKNGGRNADWAYAQSVGAIAFVRSLTDLNINITLAQTYYPTIQGFMPLGSNDPIVINPPTSVPVIITAGAGDTQNDTATGPGLENWDDDQDGDPNVDASSFSNGVICGKLLYIKDQLNCSWWEARYRARMTATGLGTRTDQNGYGKIDKALAVAFSYAIPTDPYLTVADTMVYGNIENSYKKFCDNFGLQGWSVSNGKKIQFDINDDEKQTSKTFSMSILNQTDIPLFLDMTNRTAYRCEIVTIYHFKTDQDKFRAYVANNNLKDMVRNPTYWDSAWRQVRNENIEYIEKPGSYIKARITFELQLNSPVWTA